MSGKITRVSSGEVPEGTLTDWSKLAAMDDAEIDAAIASDPDCHALSDEDFANTSSGYRYEVFQADKAWHWRLVARDGEILAKGPRSYAQERDALKAIDGLLKALLSTRLAA